MWNTYARLTVLLEVFHVFLHCSAPWSSLSLRLLEMIHLLLTITSLVMRLNYSRKSTWQRYRSSVLQSIISLMVLSLRSATTQGNHPLLN